MKIKILTPEKLIKPTVALAETWQKQTEHVDKEILREEKKLARLVQDKLSKNIVIALFDQAFRSAHSLRVVEQFIYLLKKHGIPPSFTPRDRYLMQLFIAMGKLASLPALKFLKRYIFTQTARVILDNTPQALQRHVARRQKENLQVNLNILGELILGEREANTRLKEYLAALAAKHIHYVSVKISSIYSQLHPLAHDYAKEKLKQKMRMLYTQAQRYPSERSGRPEPKFVNLDMEEYKDVRLTLEILIEVLSEKKFLSLRAGVVLQAYLPDALGWYKELLRWARARVRQGGAPIKVRLVKGANLEVEKTEAELHGWQLPIFASKLETDANYKKLLTLALQPKNIKYVNIGVASHNLFDIAYAYTLAEAYDVHAQLSFEMLEGIAESGRSVVKNVTPNFIVYAPAATAEQFINAITYLVRRLDENTKAENYLRHSLDITTQTKSWAYLKKQFTDSVRLISQVRTKPRRTQDCNRPPGAVKMQWQQAVFHNEIETDFNLPANLQWAEKIKAKWEQRPHLHPSIIPVYVGKQAIKTKSLRYFYNPNVAKKELTYKVHLAGEKEIGKAIGLAQRGFTQWRQLSWQARATKLAAVAQQLRKNRADLIGCMALVTGKVFLEGDNEITEAIDFAEYYPYSLKKLVAECGSAVTTLHGKGVQLVITPWNFPVAIPAGGMAAALMAGNSVILKPAEEAMPIALALVRCFWQAGIPRNVLQIVNCSEGKPLQTLVKHPAINGIIFTGGTATVHKILLARHDILISAETGGKNAMIVSAMADRDQAVKNIIQSAFSNTGQKCSAASLLILEEELFTSAAFKEKLRDACESLEIGSAFTLKNSIGPMIAPPAGKLQAALTNLAPGETWLVKPQRNKTNPRLLTPGIKWNVQPGAQAHCEELFGPVLAVVRAKNFSDTLTKINTTYGLTAGLESLDEREIAKWKATIPAGNLYINRSITGAIVNRQPFGGFLNTQSAYGIGFKAGGPNYLVQFMQLQTSPRKQLPTKAAQNKRRQKLHALQHASLPPTVPPHPLANQATLPAFLTQPSFRTPTVRATIADYHEWMSHYFTKSYDSSLVYGQDNYLKYLTGQKPFLLIATEQATLEAILLVLSCAYLTDNALTLLIDPKQQDYAKLHSLYKHVTKSNFTEQNKQAFGLNWENFPAAAAGLSLRKKSYCASLSAQNNICWVRSLGEVTDVAFKEACAEAGLSIINHSPYYSGRLELVYYLQEQSVSENYHRYGNLIFREQPSVPSRM